jgi:hypothetical protein
MVKYICTAYAVKYSLKSLHLMNYRLRLTSPLKLVHLQHFTILEREKVSNEVAIDQFQSCLICRLRFVF